MHQVVIVRRGETARLSLLRETFIAATAVIWDRGSWTVVSTPNGGCQTGGGTTDGASRLGAGPTWAF